MKCTFQASVPCCSGVLEWFGNVLSAKLWLPVSSLHVNQTRALRGVRLVQQTIELDFFFFFFTDRSVDELTTQ